MSGWIARWPNAPSEFGEAFGRRADELYEIDDAPVDAEGLIEAVLDAVTQFTEGAPPADDQTLLVAKVT